MQQKIICYFENESQCEAAVTALYSANIDFTDVRIVSDSTKKTDAHNKKEAFVISSSAPFALTNDYQNKDSDQSSNHTQLPVATLLIRGDLFTFDGKEEPIIDTYAVEVCGNKETLEAAKDILLNLF